MIQSREKTGLAAVLITAVCVVAAWTHWPALSAKALSFDDPEYLTSNMLVQNPGWGSAKRFLTEILEPSTVKGYYQPLEMISLMADYAAGGRENNLRPFHITSLALHIANTALIIVLLYMLFGNIWAAAAAGLLFGVHPMTVEPITWLGERKTLLAAFFSFWSLILYVRYARSGKWKSYTGSFVMYLLALLSKPTCVALPLVMLLMDYWPLKRLKTKSVVEKIPLFILSAVFAVITYISQSRTAYATLPTQFEPEYVPLVLCHNIIFYLYKMILPVNLTSYYAFPVPFGLSNRMVLAGVLGTCILISLLLVSLRRTRAALTGWLIFFAAIFPTMGIIRFAGPVTADKYAYLPCIGLLMILASFLLWLAGSKKIKITIAGVVLMLAGAEAVASQQYLAYWQDSITLANHMLTLAPGQAALYNHRGIAYCGKGEYDLALSDFNKAIEIGPEYYYVAYYNRGNIWYGKGELDLAISDFSKTIAMNPRHTKAYYNRGSIRASKGELDLAISDFSKTIAINPMYFEAYLARGNIYKKQGQFDLTIADYSKAIEINPQHAETYAHRGNMYAEGLKRFDLAVADYDKAIELNPKLTGVYFNKAIACENMGRKTEAVEAYKVFIQYAPASQYAQNIDYAKQKIKELER